MTSIDSIRVVNKTYDIPDESIVFLGDFCPIGRAEAILTDKNLDELMGDFIGFIRKPAISLANLESPFQYPGSSPIRKAGPSISLNPLIADAVSRMGISAFSLANNHIMDYGSSSLMYTVKMLSSHGSSVFGAGPTLAEAAVPFSFTLGKRSYAILAFAEMEFSAASVGRAGAYCPTMDELLPRLQDLSNIYETVIVSYHGGNEFYGYPSPCLQSRCRKMVHAGASAVICHHSHVQGAIEVYEGAPIVYGLGNFIFDRGLSKPSGWYCGYAACLSPAENNLLTISIIPFHQFDEHPAVRLFSESECKELSLTIQHQISVVVDQNKLEVEWFKWCEKQREEYLGRLLGMNKLSKKIFKLLKFPLMRLSHAKRLYMFNLINCPSHREVLLTLLQDRYTRDD